MGGEFVWTTLDEERNHFTVIPPINPPVTVWTDNTAWPSGTYRIVDGNLYRIVNAGQNL